MEKQFAYDIQGSALRQTIRAECCIGLISSSLSSDSTRNTGAKEARSLLGTRCQRILVTQEVPVFSFMGIGKRNVLVYPDSGEIVYIEPDNMVFELNRYSSALALSDCAIWSANKSSPGAKRPSSCCAAHCGHFVDLGRGFLL
jgi:hypothetical protein